MRISDWSSDVCSSDLRYAFDLADIAEVWRRGWLGIEPQDITPELARAFDLPPDTRGVVIAGVMRDGPAGKAGLRVGDIVQTVNGAQVLDTVRSEEHTSELQSLMRISYAVFCLKKKKRNTNNK